MILDISRKLEGRGEKNSSAYDDTHLRRCSQSSRYFCQNCQVSQNSCWLFGGTSTIVCYPYEIVQHIDAIAGDVIVLKKITRYNSGTHDIGMDEAVCEEEQTDTDHH